MGLLSLLLGGLSSGVGSQQPTNTNTNTSSAQSGQASSTGSTTGSSTPTFSAGQTGLQNGLFSALGNSIAGGPEGGVSDAVSGFGTALAGTKAALNPVLEGGIDTINKSTDGSIARLGQDEAGRGFGRSGQFDNNAENIELGRAGNIGTLRNSVDQQAEGLASGLQAEGDKNYYNSLSDALSAGFADPGSSTSGTTSGNTNYSNAGASVTKGSTAGTTLGGVLGGLGTFFTGASQAGAGLAGDLMQGG